MLRLFLKLYWKFYGWKLSGKFPYQYKKIVLAVAPHTHWVDVMTGFVARQAMHIEHAKFLAKKELFVWPLGWVLRKMGGTPVDRFAKQGMVHQVAALFNANETFMLGLSPEGTRKRVDQLRTGFYHIAKQANVPIVMVGLDFANKKALCSAPYYVTNNEEIDMKHILQFFGPIKGKHPENGLQHLV